MVSINISPLKNALNQLKAGLVQAEADSQNELLRDGVIQRFEYSHELAIKLIKRVLKVIHHDTVEQLSYNDILRTAADRGYIQNIDQWFVYRDARNKTSHAYDSVVAAEVYSVAKPFLDDVLFLAEQLGKAIEY